MIVECNHCEKPFTTRRRQAAFCSRACYLAKVSSETTERTCKRCKAAFRVTVNVAEQGKGIFCSAACSNTAKRVIRSTAPKAPHKFGRQTKMLTLEHQQSADIGPLIELDLKSRGFVRCHGCNATRLIGQPCVCEAVSA